MPFTTRQFHTLTNHVRLQQLLKRLESEFLPLLLSQSFAPVSEMQALHALLEALLFQAAQCGDVTVLRFLLLDLPLGRRPNVHANGEHSLLYAALHRQIDALNFLLNELPEGERADLSRCDNNMCVHFTGDRDIFNFLVRQRGGVKVLEFLLTKVDSERLPRFTRAHAVAALEAGDADILEYVFNLAPAWMTSELLVDNELFIQAARFGHAAVMYYMYELREVSELDVNEVTQAALLAAQNGHTDALLFCMVDIEPEYRPELPYAQLAHMVLGTSTRYAGTYASYQDLERAEVVAFIRYAYPWISIARSDSLTMLVGWENYVKQQLADQYTVFEQTYRSYLLRAAAERGSVDHVLHFFRSASDGLALYDVVLVIQTAITLRHIRLMRCFLPWLNGFSDAGVFGQLADYCVDYFNADVFRCFLQELLMQSSLTRPVMESILLTCIREDSEDAFSVFFDFLFARELVVDLNHFLVVVLRNMPQRIMALLFDAEQGVFKQLVALQNTLLLARSRQLRAAEMFLYTQIQRRHVIEAQRQLRPVTLNYEQSTHNRRVHQTVSASAQALVARYDLSPLSIAELTQLSKQIFIAMTETPLNVDLKRAAVRGLQRLLSPGYHYLDSASAVTTKRLLFTLFVALNDASVTLSTSSQRLQALTTALYESQRGYNFDESGKDNWHADEPICPAGTFNKLIEKWIGLHPDCRIEFMTRQTAGLKLAALTKQAVTVFLYKLAAQVRDLATFAAWVGALQSVCCGDVEPLWSAIRAPVSRVLFAEFGALFTGFGSVEFRTFVDAGRWVDVSAVPTARFELRFGCYAQTIEIRLADSYRRYQSGVLSANRRCCYQYQSAELTLRQPRRSIKRKGLVPPLFEPQPHMPKRMRYV